MRFIALALVFLSPFSSLAIRGLFTVSVFHAPETGPYIECVTSFEGNTFTLAKTDSAGLFQSKADLTIVISKLDKVVDYRKVAVEGPMVGANLPADFMSLERFSLPAGIYDLELTIRDANDREGKEEVHHQKIEINLLSDGPQVSDIQLIAAYRKSDTPTAFTKSGMDVLPYNTNFFPSSLNQLMFYAEIYHTVEGFGAGEAFVTSVCVVDAEERLYEDCRKMKREKAATVVPVFQVLDISTLPSGEYKLRIEVRNRENNLVTMKEMAFSRSQVPDEAPGEISFSRDVVLTSFAGEYNSADTLYALLQSHIPIASAVEKITIDNQLVGAELHMMQSFFYSFWYKRNPTDPRGEWLKYKVQVDFVNGAFATKQKPGWRTDRGRVYLQYGPPSTRVIRNASPDYWPFEIWHYYQTNNNLHDRRFLFYDTALNADMELLHSDVPEEMKNHNWKQLVRTRPTAVNAGMSSENNANQVRDPYSYDELEDLWYNPH